MSQVRFPDPVMWVEFVVGSLLSDIRFVTGRQTGEGFMTNHNDPSPFVSLRHVGDRPPHLCECLWYHYFIMRKIVTLLRPVSVFVLCMGRRDPSRTVTPFGDLNNRCTPPHMVPPPNPCRLTDL